MRIKWFSIGDALRRVFAVIIKELLANRKKNQHLTECCANVIHEQMTWKIVVTVKWLSSMDQCECLRLCSETSEDAIFSILLRCMNAA